MQFVTNHLTVASVVHWLACLARPAQAKARLPGWTAAVKPIQLFVSPFEDSWLMGSWANVVIGNHDVFRCRFSQGPKYVTD